MNIRIEKVIVVQKRIEISLLKKNLEIQSFAIVYIYGVSVVLVYIVKRYFAKAVIFM